MRVSRKYSWLYRFELKQKETVYDTIDHFEEISMTEISCESNAESAIKNENTQINSENTNFNNNNDNCVTEIQRPTSNIDEAAVHTESQIITKTHDLKNEEVKMASNTEAQESSNGSSKDPNHPEMASQMMPYGYDPYYVYGGYIPPYPSTSRGPAHLEYGYFPPPNRPTLTNATRKSQSETRTQPNRSGGYGNVSRGTIHRNGENIRRYPYNPGFRCTSREQYKTSTNPLIAAYQQQNVDIPKSHIQVIVSGVRFNVEFHVMLSCGCGLF